MQHGSALFVGRDRELDLLRGRLERAGAGAGTVTAIVGEAGIGKTSLAGAFAEEARARGAIVLRGGCTEGEWAAPLRPWSEALRDAARALGERRVASALGASGAAALAALVPTIRAHVEPAPLGARDERFRLFDAATQLVLHATKGGSVLLVIDDLHWADADSIALLCHAARFFPRARAAVVLTYREAEIDPRGAVAELLSTLRRETDYARVALRGLSLDEVRAVLARRAGRELPDAIVRLVYDETVGNPFHVGEVSRHLLDARRRASPSAPDGGTMRDLGVPRGAREAVARRAAQLSEDAGRVLRAASAVPSGVDDEILAAVCDLDDDARRAAIDEAIAAGLLCHVGDGRYVFAHALVRRAIYDGLKPDARARVHRRIAEALASDEARARREPAEIAAQYHASPGLPARELGASYALVAAWQARAASALDRAVSLLRAARDLAVTAPAHVRVEVLCELARAEATVMLADDARRTAELALEELLAAGAPREEVAAFLADVARELKAGGAPASAYEPLVTRALVAAGKKRDRAWARAALIDERVEALASGAVHVVRVLGPDAQAARVMREGGHEEEYAATLEFRYRTRAQTDALLAAARGWTRPTAILRALDAVARDLVYRHAAFGEGRDRARELLEAAETYGAVAAEAHALVHVAACEAVLGNVARARDVRDRAVRTMDRLGPSYRGGRLAMLGLDTLFAYLFGGDWIALVQPAARLAADPSAARSPTAHLAAGAALLGYALAGYAKESRSLLGHLAPVFERCDRRVYHYGVVLDCALLAVWHLGATDLAPRYRALAEAAPLEAGRAPFAVRDANVARMLVLEGRLTDALPRFARARAIANDASARPLRAIVDHAEASALLRVEDQGQRPRAFALLDEAAHDFDALAMEPWRAHAHRLLGRERPAPPSSRTAERPGRRARGRRETGDTG